MDQFKSMGENIAYLQGGDPHGEPILLIHGFASSVAVNWRSTSWLEKLAADGRRIIAYDVRGHGSSAKLYSPERYRLRAMAGDGLNLLDHLHIAGPVDVMGYSMGSRIATVLTLDHPERVRSLVIGGMGLKLAGGLGGEEEIAAVLEAGVPSENPVAEGYRVFAERTRSDLKALAACMRASREPIRISDLKYLKVPVLIAVGTEDRRVGSAAELAALIPNAELLDIPGRDHMLATGDRVFKAGVIDFLHRRP